MGRPPSLDLSLRLYKTMFLIRASEQEIIRRYPENEMRTPMHMSMGQEAVSTGVCVALGPQAQVYGFYRSHALFLAMTESPERFFAELYGRVGGPSRGRAGSMHLASPEDGLIATSAIVGSTIPAAVGTAFAHMQRRTGRICAVFFGDGALETGDFWESLNAACAIRVPVLFICEDNGYAVHTPQSVRHGFARISDVVRQFRCVVIEEVATDVEAVYTAAKAACASLRPGPVFLWVKTYRYLDHIGIHDDLEIGYRTRAEFQAWRSQDPLDLQRRRIIDLGMTEVEVLAEEQRIIARVDQAVEAARSMPVPGPEELTG